MSQVALARAGMYLYGLGTLGAGVLDLIWGEFEAAHQPIQALADPVPGQAVLAYITAVWMISAGAAIFWRRTARVGALAAAIIYLVFGLFWLPRLYFVPQILGFRLTVFVGLLGGMFMQLVAAVGGLIAVRNPAALARWILGVGSVLFGSRHLIEVENVARMVPGWMPFGGAFWAIVSGIAFVLAGVAIASEVLDAWAARLLALMVLIFEGPVLIPLVIAHPHQHIAWGANAYNLAAAGAIAIFAASVNRQVAPDGPGYAADNV